MEFSNGEDTNALDTGVATSAELGEGVQREISVWFPSPDGRIASSSRGPNLLCRWSESRLHVPLMEHPESKTVMRLEDMRNIVSDWMTTRLAWCAWVS